MRDSDAGRSLRELAEEVLFATAGAAWLTKERVEDLAEELSSRGRISREEARQAVDDVAGRWRRDAVRLGERASYGFGGVFRELGLVTRREYEELELRLAQVEHRLRLVEPPEPPLDAP